MRKDKYDNKMMTSNSLDLNKLDKNKSDKNTLDTEKLNSIRQELKACLSCGRMKSFVPDFSPTSSSIGKWVCPVCDLELNIEAGVQK